MDSFSFTKYTDNDFKDYKNLYKSVYGKDIDKKFFLWKHKINISINQKPIIYLIVNPEKAIVGSISFFTTKLIYNKYTYAIVQAGDVMLLENYRGKNLFKKSLEFALKDLKNNGYDGIFAFPNNKSCPGFLKLGFNKLYKVNLYVKILDYKSLLKRKLGDKPGLNTLGKILNFFMSSPIHNDTKFDIEEVDLLQNNILNFIEKCNKNYIHQDKNKDFLEWKYLDKPKCTYETLLIKIENKIQAIFIIRIDNVSGRISGKIMEYFSNDDIGASTYFNLVSNYYTNKGLDYIEIWDIGSESLKYILKKNNFIKRKVDLYFIVKIFNEEIGFINDLTLWKISAGDADTA